jgi:hypothetical protein
MINNFIYLDFLFFVEHVFLEERYKVVYGAEPNAELNGKMKIKKKRACDIC